MPETLRACEPQDFPHVSLLCRTPFRSCSMPGYAIKANKLTSLSGSANERFRPQRCSMPRNLLRFRWPRAVNYVQEPISLKKTALNKWLRLFFRSSESVWFWVHESGMQKPSRMVYACAVCRWRTRRDCSCFLLLASAIGDAPPRISLDLDTPE